MTDALVDNLSEYLNSVEISPGSSNEGRVESRNSLVTALTLPEPIEPTIDDQHIKVDRNSAVINHKLNTGIIYRDYISDSSDLNSDTSSIDDQQFPRQQFRQSTGELTLISKSVSVDTHNSSEVSSSIVPAERNPVSDLLRSPTSSIESDDEETAISEYYSAESLHNKLSQHHTTQVLSSDSIHRLPQQNRVLATNNEPPPPPPPPPSSLKKMQLHYDNTIIPDTEEDKLSDTNQNYTSVIPNLQSNVKSRFITMEEQLEVNDDLYISSGEDKEISSFNLPNNISTLNLALPANEELTQRKPEVRSLEQRRSIKRLNAIKELMDTEETYSRDLGILCTHFFAIIKEATCISQEEVDILIRNAMDILAFQEKFTEALIEAHGDEEEERNGIFYKGNLKRIALCFVEWPFQRIFRYRLLLQSITKATQKDSEEYEILSQAQNTIHVIATRINNEKSKMEAKRKTTLFLSRLDSDWCLPKRWFNTLGVCNLIGTLEVRCIEDNKAKRIGCALFNHYMIMAKAKKHKLYEPRHWFPLRKFEIENLPNTEGSMTYSWLLHSDEHTLELSAICELEKHIWMESLSKAIKESKDLYSNSVDSNEYLLEQLFVSSFDQHTQNKASGDKTIEPESPVHFPMPSGSTSFSQSAIFNKPSRANHRASQPVFSAHEFSVIDSSLAHHTYNYGAQSPGLRSQSSISDLRDFFSNSMSEKWSQRKFNQYHTRCKSVDTKFDDVCTTPILTARANSMNRNGSTKRRKVGLIPSNHTNSSVISLVKSTCADPIASPLIHSPAPLDGFSPVYNDATSRRPSVSTQNTDSMIFRLAQRNSYLHRSNSITSCAEAVPATAAFTTTALSTTTTTAGLLPPSNSTLSLSNRPSKFFGRMVEKLGQMGTPGKSRRNNMMSSVPSLVNSSSSTLSSKPPTLSETNRDQKMTNSNSSICQSTPTSSKKK
ncbi:hypothetical protein INT48_002519, partial [Thamnidium elegans]